MDFLKIPKKNIVKHAFKLFQFCLFNFLPVKILGGSDKEIIVGGLPRKLRIITVGQGFVESGDKVLTFKEN